MTKQQTGTAGSRRLQTAPIQTNDPIDFTSISALAHKLWEERGRPEGSPEVDWFEAERQLLGRSADAPAAQTSEPLLVRRSGA